MSDGARRRPSPRLEAAVAARAAVEQVVALTGRELDSVVSLEPREKGWRVGVEVVEARRVPDSADILALFEVEVGDDGELHRYRRVRRHCRGQVRRGER